MTIAGGTTVLVVDDSADTRELYSLVLSSADCAVIEAATVAEAVRLASERKPGVLLCDWLLPDGRGLELCQRVRRLPAMRKTHIVAVTGVVMTPTFREELRRAGVHAILEKPVCPDRIVDAVGRGIDLRRVRQLRAAAVRVCRAAGSLLRGAPRTAEDRATLQADAVTVVARAANAACDDIAIMLADDGGRYVAANSTAAALTGYPPADLVGLSIWDLTPIPKSVEGREMWTRFIASGSQQGRYLLRRRDGGAVEAQYFAIANVTPGLHLSALMQAGCGRPALGSKSDAAFA